MIYCGSIGAGRAADLNRNIDVLDHEQVGLAVAVGISGVGTLLEGELEERSVVDRLQERAWDARNLHRPRRARGTGQHRITDRARCIEGREWGIGSSSAVGSSWTSRVPGAPRSEDPHNHRPVHPRSL